VRVLLVTSWGTACGIAEHSAMLKEAVEQADPSIEIVPSAAMLDPRGKPGLDGFDVLHLNYQAGLHSQWTPTLLQRLDHTPTLVTYHDTGVPNSDQCKAVIDAADAAVVHEPFDDLPVPKTRYWRMGVLDLPPTRADVFARNHRPIIGTIGFPFPWKCYEALLRAAAEAGWGVMLLAPGASAAQVEHWLTLNPQCFIQANFTGRQQAVAMLAQCDATAFTYVCHNTGQSGAILLGIAARKPVFALRTCRQFRALWQDPMGRLAIRWVETFENLTDELHAQGRHSELDSPTCALAEQESWAALGRNYAVLYRQLAGGA